MKSFFYVNSSDITSNSCTLRVPLIAQSQTIHYSYEIYKFTIRPVTILHSPNFSIET